uniref:Pleckstrin homology domain-containing family G member 4B n=1 Tax=Cacopsylla melanoneura TaxID=428564 RepID=A0A8D9FHX3_9HEMI
MSVLDLASQPAPPMEKTQDYAVEDLCNVELVNDLCSLITSVDHAIERVALDDLAFPCPSCQQCILQSADEDYAKCECEGPNRTEKQTKIISQSHESIPHIDSDEESIPDNDRSIMGARKLDEFKHPTSISEIPEHLLMSGIHFPGIHDTSGRSVIVYDATSVAKSGLDTSDIGKVILYYVSLPVRPERTKHGITLLVLSGLPGDATYDHLDKALTFLESKVLIACLLVWRKTASGPRVTEAHRQRLQRSNSNVLPNSKIEYQVLDDIEGLRHYLDEEQTPAECGGPTSHDQLEWVEFYKEYEPFLSQCHGCGRSLVTTMADIRDVSATPESDRRSLVTSHRAICRVLTDPALCKLRRDGHRTLTQLEERAHWLPYSEDVKICVERADRLFAEVERGSKRLEQLCQKRKEKIREQQRMKALHTETTEVLSWLKCKGATTLKRHTSLASTLPALKAQEQDFEKFYFISMRNLDKAGDLLEECGGSPSGTLSGGGLKDLARNLKQHLRGFSERLEDTRERLEDTSRCYYLLDRAYEWALEAMKYISRVKPEDQTSNEPTVKQLRQYLMAHPPLTSEHFTEMITLAKKLSNDKLIEQCKVAQCRCEETLDQIRTYLGSDSTQQWNTSTPLPSRRKSLPAPSPTPAPPSHHTPSNACPCWDPGDSPLPSPSIPEECYCRTGNHTSHPLQRSCTWQYPTENYDEEEDKVSSVGNTTEGSDTGKSGEDCEDTSDNSLNKPVPPVSVNSHLHYSQLSLDLDSSTCGVQTLKTQKNLLFIMREMIQTERDYVKSLEYVILNYIPELSREDIPQALRGQRNVIFGNIEKIYEFHSQHFLLELEQCAALPLSVGQCFLNHENKFYLYALYNKNKPKSDSLMTEYGSAFFKTKQVELADRMDLASYLLKPVQRMGKYALLLQQLMKASRQDVKDIKDIQEAESMVRFQLRHGNDLLAMDSLRECDVNLKEQGRLLRQNEFIVSQGKGKKCLRHVFLFEELILFSKARRFPDRKNLDLYIYKHSMKMSDIGITAQIGDSSTKFEIWFRKRKPNETFTLQSMSEDIKQAWADELSNLLWKQALRNRAMRYQEMSSMGIGNKPCLDIRPSADQISDRSISITQLNKTTPKFRNSIAVMPGSDTHSSGGPRTRPHSIISLSSSSGGSSSGSVGGGGPHKTSQCSSAESGIVTDWHTTRSNSSVTSDSTSPSHQVSVKL